MGFIYLASPYSHHDPAVREIRALKAADAALALIERGHAVYSPIAAWHHWCGFKGLPFTFAHWRPQDEAMIEASQELWVLMLDGWEESEGVAEEINTALLEMIPVKYIDPDTLVVFNSPPVIGRGATSD